MRTPHLVFWATFTLTVATLAAPAGAQETHDHAGGGLHHVDARRADIAPTIDGVLDEAVWREAPMLDNFTQQEPANGEPATERTEVRLLYDAEHLYIGVQALTPSPSGVIATEMRRDSARHARRGQLPDHPRHVPRLPVRLHVRDQSARREAGTADLRRRRGERRAARPRTSTATGTACGRPPRARTDDGWVAEIAIPMVTVRSPDVDVQAWGINFMRNIRRKNEQVYWAPIPKPYGLTQVSLAGTVIGHARADTAASICASSHSPSAAADATASEAASRRAHSATSDSTRSTA